jgi:hypothetical protein
VHEELCEDKLTFCGQYIASDNEFEVPILTNPHIIIMVNHITKRSIGSEEETTAAYLSPLSTVLVEFIQQVIALAVSQQPLSILLQIHEHKKTQDSCTLIPGCPFSSGFIQVFHKQKFQTFSRPLSKIPRLVAGIFDDERLQGSEVRREMK